jgi:hypothetical protein
MRPRKRSRPGHQRLTGLVIDKHFDCGAVTGDVRIEVANPMESRRQIKRLELLLERSKDWGPEVKWHLSSCAKPAKCQSPLATRDSPRLPVNMLARMFEESN